MHPPLLLPGPSAPAASAVPAAAADRLRTAAPTQCSRRTSGRPPAAGHRAAPSPQRGLRRTSGSPGKGAGRARAAGLAVGERVPGEKGCAGGRPRRAGGLEGSGWWLFPSRPPLCSASPAGRRPQTRGGTCRGGGRSGAGLYTSRTWRDAAAGAGGGRACSARSPRGVGDGPARNGSVLGSRCCCRPRFRVPVPGRPCTR